MKKIFFIIIILATIMLLPELAIDVYAPPIIPDTNTGNPVGGAPAGVPIDGGLGFLAAAGIAYASKKINDKRKENS